MKEYSVLLVDDEEDVVEAIIQKIDWAMLRMAWKPWRLQRKSKLMWYSRILRCRIWTDLLFLIN